jgi:lipopolysaccharide export system protein LptC
VKFWLTLVLLAVIAGASTWALRHLNPSAPSATPAPGHAPDYYLKGATITQLGTTGKLDYRLLAKQATHHPDDGSVDLSAPRLTWYGDQSAQNKPWRVTAAHGLVPAGGNIVHLTGHVVVTHREKGGATLKIFTPRLDLETQNRVARTDAPVRIVRGPSHVHATGMVIQLTRNHLRLENAVRGTYVP